MKGWNNMQARGPKGQEESGGTLPSPILPLASLVAGDSSRLWAEGRQQETAG